MPFGTSSGRLDLKNECNGPPDKFGEKLVERIADVLEGALINGEGDI